MVILLWYLLITLRSSFPVSSRGLMTVPTDLVNAWKPKPRGVKDSKGPINPFTKVVQHLFGTGGIREQDSAEV